MSRSAGLDHRMMGRALREGRRGRPSPNPHVGAVVVRGEEIVATGHHRRAGEAHAEGMALARAGELARGATLYCTLEPCNHHGRTPPCTEAILRAGVARVVIGCADPKPHVPGAIARLRAAGVEVELGVREAEAAALVADFAHHIVRGLPYTVLKAAITLDGRIASRSGDSRWITGARARREAHRARDRADAVVIGVGTLLADDPALTVRHVKGRDPIRVVLDTHLRTPARAAMLRGDSRAPTWIAHGPSAPPARREELEAAGAVLIEAPLAGGRLSLDAVWRTLARRDVVRVLVEGGGEVHGALLDAGLVQRVSLFVAPRLLADAEAKPLAAGRPKTRVADAHALAGLTWKRLGDDLWVEGELKPGSDDE